MKREKVYKTPKDIASEFGISTENLKKHRLAGHLIDIQWSAGKGKPYYEIGEIKKVFHLTTTFSVPSDPAPFNKYGIPIRLWKKFRSPESKAIFNYMMDNTVKNQSNLHVSKLLLEQKEWEVLCHNMACYAAWGIDKIKK